MAIREIPENRILTVLQEKGLTQAQLSRLTGIMPATICSIIKKRIYPFKAYQEKISSALGVQPIDIFDPEYCQEGSENKVGNSIANIYSITCTKSTSTDIKRCTMKGIDNKGGSGEEEGRENYEDLFLVQTEEKSKKTKNEYSKDFETFWSIYPHKTGKLPAFNKWKTNLRQGVKPSDMIAAALEYKKECAGREERLILHPKTFLGHNKYWLEILERKEKDNGLSETGAGTPEDFFGFAAEEFDPFA